MKDPSGILIPAVDRGLRDLGMLPAAYVFVSVSLFLLRLFFIGNTFKGTSFIFKAS